jgi:hypothetical protein
LKKITERLTWCTALKDQAGITKDLADGKDVEEVYGLGEAGLFDEFFCFLSHFGIQDLLMKLKPEIKQIELSDFLIWKSKKILNKEDTSFNDKTFAPLEKMILNLKNKDKVTYADYGSPYKTVQVVKKMLGTLCKALIHA